MKPQQDHHVDSLFVFMLLGIFAVLATIMVAFSAQIYRTTVSETAAHNETRVLYSYLMNTVHANDAANAVMVREENGIPMLVLTWHDEEGTPLYETRLYGKDGMLYELLCAIDDPFDDTLGELICRADCFVPTIAGSLLTIRASENTEPICIALRCKEVQP